MKKNNKWKRMCSGILAVCLVATLLLSNQSFGVFAESTDNQVTEQEAFSDAKQEDDAIVQNTQQKKSDDAEMIRKSSSVEASDVMDESENAETLSMQRESANKDEKNDVNIASENADTIVFDLAKGDVKFSDSQYSGFDSSGNEIKGNHDSNNKYEIRQSNPNESTSHKVMVGTTAEAVREQFVIYLSGINICVEEDCPIYANSGAGGKVYFILKNKTNNIAKINDNNKANIHAAVEKELTTPGLLCITCEEGYEKFQKDETSGHECTKNDDCGALTAYANLTDDIDAKKNNGPYVSGAGIGTRGKVNGGSIDANGKINVTEWLDNLVIAGGKVTSYGAAGDERASGGGAGIGTGSCINAQDTSAGIRNFSITGGYINAIAGDDSASCIGGGYRSNEVSVKVYGGTIIANERVKTNKAVRGTGIGAGGGGSQSGSPSIAKVYVHGGNITASSQYGAAIGGAGSGDGTGSYTKEHTDSQPAFIYIYGGEIHATSTGNGAAIGTGGPIGTTTTGSAGDATVVIEGGTIEAESESGSDIGGGGVLSTDKSSNGGNANITISKGSITTKRGGIGGGLAVNGTGGKAQVTISGGQVTTPSIGGGTSKENIGGDAAVCVSDGVLSVNGKIGGGDSESNKGGDASINVTGGTLDCASIGGGNSKTGLPGAVTSETESIAGVVVTGGTLKTGTIGGGTNDKKDIGFATANISGGTIQGQFILANTDTNKHCSFTMTNGMIDNSELDDVKYKKAQKNGGAVYLSDPKGEVDISGGTIRKSTAERGGAVYMTNGTFILSGTATIQECTATGDAMVNDSSVSALGGAVYLGNGMVTMNGGCILSSNATNGGAVYLKEGTVILSGGTIGIEQSPNKADKGAGVYVAGGNLNVNGGSIAYNEASNGAGAYLQGGSMKVSDGRILHNTASENGAGAYLASGTLEMSSGIITENAAEQNGGGVFLEGGNMTLSGGRIYSNSAVKGAGAYLNGGNLTMSDGSDFDTNTASQDGGGAYLAGGTLTIDNGTFKDNTASQDGGGAYLAGGTLTINGGAFNNNTASNGAGAYVADGIVRMFGGNITNNTASGDGGGFYVSSDNRPADVVIRSGTISGNKAGNSSTQGNGGAIAVASDNSTNADHVVIGLRHAHPNLNVSERTFDSFTYTDEIDSIDHLHKNCPVITGNQATGNGGGIYMASSQSTLDVYCLLENENVATIDKTGGSIMSIGGHVNIGDVGDNGKGNNTASAVGNIFIQSPMLIKGGDVKIYGNTDNPKFEDKILVNIQKEAGSFEDNRYTMAHEEDINYKIEFFENFKDSGAFTAIQYAKNDTIRAIGNMYEHEGYKIVGWDTQKDGKGSRYNTGEVIDHSAWKGKEESDALTLYAIWEKISYTVAYKPGVSEYSGKMESQTFTYGEENQLATNQFKVKGKHFTGWNTEENGRGKTYDAEYNESKMTTEDGKTVTLYAQWIDCTHLGGEHPGELTYKPDPLKIGIITESCNCGGHEASVMLSGADVFYDGYEHPGTLSYVGDFLTEKPTIAYEYKAEEDGTYSELTGVPVEKGYYKASITVGEVTVSVEYQIKSPAEAASIAVKASCGQYFMNFQGNDMCTVSADDAFTIQYDVQELNKGTNVDSQKVYMAVPKLTFDMGLPVGTSIIMQTADDYYWYKTNTTTASASEIPLTDFRKMGSTTNTFTYDTTNINNTQQYRFIIDFSDTSGMQEKRDFHVGLKYEYNTMTGMTETNNDLKKEIVIAVTTPSDFSIQVSGNNCKVTAPDSTNQTRWEGKNLVWRFKTSDTTEKLPADAKLTVSTTENQQVKTMISSINKNGEFIIPFAWTGEQEFTFALSSNQETTGNKTYKLKAALCIGSKIDSTRQPVAQEDSLQKVSADIDLSIPVITKPSLKISGMADNESVKRVFSKSESLKVNINYKNLAEGSVIQAVIQKKTDKGYGGEFYKASVGEPGNYTYALQSTEDAGSYRLLVTVSSKSGQKLLEVPYYFIVK